MQPCQLSGPALASFTPASKCLKAWPKSVFRVGWRVELWKRGQWSDLLTPSLWDFGGKCGRTWGNAPLLWDPLSSPFVLGSRIGGSPDFDRFAVSHGRQKTQGIAGVGNEPSPPCLCLSVCLSVCSVWSEIYKGWKAGLFCFLPSVLTSTDRNARWEHRSISMQS